MSTNIILYATDYSPASVSALPIAESLARDAGAKLLIVHVSESEITPVGELFDEEPQAQPAELQRLQAIVPSDQRISYEHRLVYGEPGSDDITRPAEEILRLAKREQASLIVVGTHGRTGLGRLLMGSVADTLIARSPCPVVTLRQP